MSSLPDAFTLNSSAGGDAIRSLPQSPGNSRLATIDSWQKELAAAIRSSSELLSRLGLIADSPSENDLQTTVEQVFPVLVPESYFRRIRPGDPADPLLKQVLADSRELLSTPGFQSDAVQDLAARRVSGVLHKYEGRVLLIASGACAVHCRYCFRREYPYGDEPKRLEDWQPALELLAQDSSIHEVILSGGDPLMLNDERLSRLCHQIDVIPHIERIRFHTRLPIVLPSRISDSFLQMTERLRVQCIMVVHANHANEIVDDCRDCLQRMVRSGIPVLNQAVLLKGVNDSAAALIQLCRALINIGVLPYYLHQMDRVAGTSHFEVSEQDGRRLIAEISGHLPGYAVPRYVREIPGASGKTPL